MRLLFSFAILLICTATAQAADAWSGIYAGVNIGYHGSKLSDAAGNGSRMSGFAGGGQLGAQRQAGPIVIGIETDFQGSSASRSDSYSVAGVGVTDTWRQPWFGSIRTRAGLAHDNVMAYATAGWAYGNFAREISFLGSSYTANTTANAFVYGGGIEWKFADHWSARAEYLHLQSQNATLTIMGIPVTGKAENNMGRMGLNYHF